MMFQNKLDRAMDWLKNKNKISEGEIPENIQLEKNDFLAIIIAALLVFGPIIIILFIIIYLLL